MQNKFSYKEIVEASRPYLDIKGAYKHLSQVDYFIFLYMPFAFYIQNHINYYTIDLKHASKTEKFYRYTVRGTFGSIFEYKKLNLFDALDLVSHFIKTDQFIIEND